MVKITVLSMDCWIDMLVACIQTLLFEHILFICIRALERLGSMSIAVLFWKKYAFWEVDHNSRLKIYRKTCYKHICHHLGFVPHMEHMQSRFDLILKNSRIFGMVNEYWLQFNVTKCISPWQELTCPLKFQSQALISHLYLWKCYMTSSNLRLFHLHWKSVEEYSHIHEWSELHLLGNLLQVWQQHLLLLLALWCYGDGFFP